MLPGAKIIAVEFLESVAICVVSGCVFKEDVFDEALPEGTEFEVEPEVILETLEYKAVSKRLRLLV